MASHPPIQLWKLRSLRDRLLREGPAGRPAPAPARGAVRADGTGWGLEGHRRLVIEAIEVELTSEPLRSQAARIPDRGP